MKARIFIAMHYLEIGGAERSLLGLLSAIDHRQFEVDLFLYQHSGEFMPLIPKEVRLLPEEPKYRVLESSWKEALRRGYVDVFLARIWAKLAHCFYVYRHRPTESAAIFQYVANATTPLLPSLHKYGTYDLAISFLTPHNIVLEKVKAKKKVAWIHTDYTTIHVNAKQEMKIWGQFDHIVSISEQVSKSFVTTFPSLANKITLIENILSPEFVKSQAELLDASQEMAVPQGGICLCSVGRFSNAKNFDNLPIICRLLKEKGLLFKWFIVGYGADEARIKQGIEEQGVSDVLQILGKKENPYPYIKYCDVYIQPSRYEGKAVTVREAQILGKPVAITRFPTSSSQLVDGVDGVIVPMENQLMAEELFLFLTNKEKQKQLAQYVATHDYGNESEVEKLYKLI